MTNNEGIIFINCPNCGESLEINSQQVEEICPICKSPLDIQTLAVAESQPTRKDKIKELLGRNLNSYHVKAKQLLTDIENKNKEQNHKISVLTNKLDNDYLTKTEEGSVISLDYSKEGMVYLDELQGNTMVNYCTDGSKELTLNGDIDIEGTFVTTTEGVDNGLVDVMCEGNTLVNLIKVDTSEYKTIGHASSNMLVLGDASLFQNGKQYTIICEFSDIVGNARVCFNFNSGGSAPDIHVKPTQGLVKHTFTMPTEPTIKTNAQVKAYYFDQENSCKIKNLIILEGDWSNKELPPYFEGMKSVGQDDENGHKIEILSQSKNLFDKNNSEFSKLYIHNINVGYEGSFSQSSGLRSVTFKCKKNTDYTISKLNGYAFRIYGAKEKPVAGIMGKFLFANNGGLVTTINSEDYSYLQIVYYSYNSENTGEVTEQQVIDSLQVEYGETQTSYMNYNLNKKEVSLNEPLRSLPNGVKDRFIKIGGKWYIERNCKQLLINGLNELGDDWDWHIASTDNNITRFFLHPYSVKKQGFDNIICDKMPTNETYAFTEGVAGYDLDGRIYVKLLNTKASNVSELKTYLSQNNLKVIFELNTPVYEPLEIEPTLNTYNDITHISNDSLIPCNMKIQNSGYNAIIKPSTLYTIALDTNRTRTIGCNLGGAKGTTTNNVLTLTTPAILADDSLRIYGKGIKGIKGSKIRLLEGDRTNWIPSFFEGMKSSFEDKLQDDGTYKMEILSNNENLIDFKKITKRLETTDIEMLENGFKITDEFYASIKIKVKPFKNYYIGFETTKNTVAIYDVDTKKSLGSSRVPFIFNSKDHSELLVLFYGGVGTRDSTTFTNIVLKEGSSSTLYISNKSNKIQFSSIEPLRKWDKLVFKDGQLMIERNSKEVIFDGTESWLKDGDSKNGYQRAYISNIPTLKTTNDLVDKLPSDYNLQYLYESYCRSGAGYFELILKSNNLEEFKARLKQITPIKVSVPVAEPTYEEIPYELQKIILEGYENGTLFFDTNIPPTATVTYAGEAPIVSAVKSTRTNVSSNTDDINDNIVPYLMDMDYRVVCLQLAENTESISVARLLGGTYEMLQRDIQSKRYPVDEYKHRLDAYLEVKKITEEEYIKLGEMLNEQEYKRNRKRVNG